MLEDPSIPGFSTATGSEVENVGAKAANAAVAEGDLTGRRVVAAVAERAETPDMGVGCRIGLGGVGMRGPRASGTVTARVKEDAF
jgi:hypothetical protein